MTLSSTHRPRFTVALACALAILPGCDDSDSNERGQEEMTSLEPEPHDTPSGRPCSLLVINALSFDDYAPDITTLHVSRSTSPVWGIDQLGAQVLEFGQGIEFTDIPAGLYDVQAIDEDEYTYSRYDVVCDASPLVWDISADDED